MLIILVDFSRLGRFFILDKTLQILFFVLHNVMLYFVRVNFFPDITLILIFLLKILAFAYIWLQWAQQVLIVI